MSERFVWVSDPERGEWLRQMEAEPFGDILSVVPRGFQAYARVFHPVERDRPQEKKTWQDIDAMTYFDDIEVALETQRASWAKAAASFGTTMHAEAQYARLVRGRYGDADGAIAADSWRYADTLEGSLDVPALSAAAGVLARHTTTPGAGVAAIWDGWGGLVSSDGVSYLVFESTDPLSADAPDEAVAHTAHRSLRERFTSGTKQGIGAARSMIGTLAGPTRKEPESDPGLLPRKVAAGPRFELHADTGRSYVLFEAGASDFVDASWPHRAPWVDAVSWAQSPSTLWPEDHSWVLATEIDFASTLIAGTAALIRELVQTPGLEVLPIRTDADLSWDGDSINRPRDVVVRPPNER